MTPAHHFPDFRLKTYAPLAFRYFRELFGIKPDDYLVRVETQTWSKLHYHSDSAQYAVSFNRFGCKMLFCWECCVNLNFSTPSAMSHWSSCPTLAPAVPGSTLPAMTSSSSRRCSIKRLSSYRNCFLVTTWWVAFASISCSNLTRLSLYIELAGYEIWAASVVKNHTVFYSDNVF